MSRATLLALFALACNESPPPTHATIETVDASSASASATESPGSPVVRESTPEVSGGLLPMVVIERIMHANRDRFRRCVDRARETNPRLAGRVFLKFTIDLKGAVARADYDHERTTLADDGALACILAELRTIAFPEPSGSVVVVTYPLAFD